MKRLICLFVFIVFVSSCAKVGKLADGSIYYERIGPQKLDGVTMTLGDGSSLSFEKQEADVTKLIDAFIAFLQQLKK